MDCKECHERFRADKLIEDYNEANEHSPWRVSIDAWSQEQMKNYIEEKRHQRVRPAVHIISQTSVSST